MNKIIILISLILLSTSVFAFNLGQTFNQTQLDDTTINYNTTLNFIAGTPRIEEGQIKIMLIYRTLIKNENNYFVIFRGEEISYDLEDYANCRTTSTKLQCLQIIKNNLNYQLLLIKRREIDKMNLWKTKTTKTEIVPKDITINGD